MMDIQIFREAFDTSIVADMLDIANTKDLWTERYGYLDVDCQEPVVGNVSNSRKHTQTFVRELPTPYQEWVAQVEAACVHGCLLPTIVDMTELEFMPPRILRYKVGEFYAAHSDVSMMTDGTKLRTVVMYLSECEGGELVFPYEGVRVKPRPGTAACFSPGLIHESTPVTAGIKYNIVSWLVERCAPREVSYLQGSTKEDQ